MSLSNYAPSLVGDFVMPSATLEGNTNQLRNLVCKVILDSYIHSAKNIIDAVVFDVHIVQEFREPVSLFV